MNRIIHFELSSPDMQKSRDFFRKGFGWEFHAWPGEESIEGIDGAIMPAQDGRPRTVNIVEVESIDESISRLTDLGGTCIGDKMPIPGFGYSAYFADPAGVMFGIYQPDRSVHG